MRAGSTLDDAASGRGPAVPALRSARYRWPYGPMKTCSEFYDCEQRRIRMMNARNARDSSVEVVDVVNAERLAQNGRVSTCRIHSNHLNLA